MQILNTLALLTATASLGSAAPPPVEPKFLIVSKAISGNNSNYGGLYLSPYHSGAGENFPAFTTSKKTPYFRFNGTRLVTTLSKVDYGVAFGATEDTYAAWGPLTINAGEGDRGFVLKNGNIVSKSKDIDFGGWRICDWVHGVPELFYDSEGKFGRDIVPANCELVNLIPLYAP